MTISMHVMKSQMSHGQVHSHYSFLDYKFKCDPELMNFAAIIMPIVGCILGVITGALIAFIYNFAAKRIGGIKLQLN